MSALDIITADLSWRETELGALKAILIRAGNTSTQKAVLLRAAWAMLYAHYEGFSKFCLTVFYDQAKSRVAACRDLPNLTRAFALEPRLKEMKSYPAHSFLEAVEGFVAIDLGKQPEFPEVETESNLWPNLLIALLEKANIQSTAVDEHRIKLKTLVSRRNEIAHGQQNFITELDYYFSFESAVYAVMYDLAFLVDERLNRAPYF